MVQLLPVSAMGARQNILNVKSHQRTTNKTNIAITDTKNTFNDNVRRGRECPFKAQKRNQLQSLPFEFEKRIISQVEC